MPAKKNKKKNNKEASPNTLDKISELATSNQSLQEVASYNVDLSELIKISRSVQDANQSLILNELFKKAKFIPSNGENVNNIDYVAIFKENLEIWKDCVIKLLSETDFAYEYYNAIVEKLNQDGKITLAKQWSPVLTKLIIGIYYEIHEKGNNDLKVIMVFLRNLALHKLIKEKLLDSLKDHGIIPGIIMELDKEVEIFYLPNGNRILMPNEPLALLNLTREVERNREHVVRQVCRGRASADYNDCTMPLVMDCIAEFLNKALSFCSIPGDFKGEMISVAFIKRAFKEIKKTASFIEDSDDVTTAFIVAFTGVFSIYERDPGKTLQDFENNFITFILSYSWKAELNNLINNNSFAKNIDKIIDVLSKNLSNTSKALNLRYIDIYKLSLSFGLTRKKFDDRENEIIAALALDYFALKNEQRKELFKEKESKKPVDINQNGGSAEPKENTAQPSLNIFSCKETANDNDQVAISYLDNLINQVGVIPIFAEYMQDRKEGMKIKGVKPDFVSLSEGNIQIVMDFMSPTPIIFVFNKQNMNISERYLEALTSKKIDYYGIGKNGNKINFDASGQVKEVHIKFLKDGERYTIPSTYNTSLMINGVTVAICYFDRELTPEEWHEEHRMNVPQYQEIPSELHSMFFHPAPFIKQHHDESLVESPTLGTVFNSK